ncbi:MAG: helix-turn-helix domain-containing protein, partial [Solirubrobacteraceae bacterium]
MSRAERVDRRQAQAAETGRLIINAARRLFATQGYGATSIVQIAEEAGVAVPTIYANLGTKLRLLELLNDRIDQEAGVGELVPQLMAC